MEVVCWKQSDGLNNRLAENACVAVCFVLLLSLLLLLLLLKKASSARLRESDVHPISLKTPAPQYQPIDRKKRKGKRVVDYSIGIEQLRPIKKHWPCS